MRHSAQRLAGYGLSIMGLAACGGGGGSGLGIGGGSTSGGGSGNASPGGYWTGTLTTASSQDSALALIDENGAGFLVDQSNGRIYRFSAVTSGGQIATSALRAYARSGQTLDDGSLAESGSFSGTISARSQLSATLSVGGVSSTFALAYEPTRYEVPASLATLAGTYAAAVTQGGSAYSVTLTFASSGSISGSDGNGCTYAGTASVTNTAYDAYRFQLSRTCGSTTTALTGLANRVAASGSASAMLTLEYDDSAASSTSQFAVEGVATAQ